MSAKNRPGISRRAVLKRLATASLAASLPGKLFGQAPGSAWRSRLRDYLEQHARPDGGYAWADQEASHLTPTYAVIGCYHLLGVKPPRPAVLAECVRTHHPARLKKLEQEHREFEYQQIQSLVWLGEDVSAFRDQVDGWKSPTVYLKQYEQRGNPILRHEVTAFTCRALLGLPVAGLADYLAYVKARRRANGSFNNTPAADGGDGHVINTWWGLLALSKAGLAVDLRPETAKWLQACQRPNGGFTWQPKPDFGGGDDVVYTWAAVRALQLLGAAPADRDACVKYLHSLANADGGFADRPGWATNPLATYYALDALDALGELDSLKDCTPQPGRHSASLPPALKVFSAQVEAHGQGSPAEAVLLARALKIHLWGAKNSSDAWLARAQAVAERGQVPVRFFVANEEYGTWVKVPGLGTYSHISDIVVPAGADFGSSLAKAGVVSWPEFRSRRLDPLRRAGGRLIWQFGENEELVRLFLDDSLERGGYAAISTFHFGNPDFTNSEPFLQCYRGRIPFVALQDAHGDEPWWFADKTAGFRTLFLGTEPTWEAWLKALENNWTVAVRHDAVSGNKTWLHGGSAETVDFVRRQERNWRWWDNADLRRPLVSLVALTRADTFEAGRPETGVALRVRCAWECAAQGQLKTPMAELVRLQLDGDDLAPKLVSRKGPRGTALVDQYHLVTLPELKAGTHTVTAVMRNLETRAEFIETLKFSS